MMQRLLEPMLEQGIWYNNQRGSRGEEQPFQPIPLARLTNQETALCFVELDHHGIHVVGKYFEGIGTDVVSQPTPNRTNKCTAGSELAERHSPSMASPNHCDKLTDSCVCRKDSSK